NQLAELETKAAQVAKNCPSVDETELFWFKFRSCKGEIEVELAEFEPKRLKLHEKLAELEALIRNLSQRDAEIQLKPSFDEFSRKLSAIVETAIRDKHPELPRVRPMIEGLQRDTQDAWKNKDRLGWARVNNQLTQISYTLAPQLSPAERARMI